MLLVNLLRPRTYQLSFVTPRGSDEQHLEQQLGRRKSLGIAAGLLASTPNVALAVRPYGSDDDDGLPDIKALWEITIPPGNWQTIKYLKGMPRKKKELIFEAYRKTKNGPRIYVSREPLGSGSRFSLIDPERTLELADAFDGTRKATAEEIVAIVTKRFEDQYALQDNRFMDVKRYPERTFEFTNDAGKRFVFFEYDTMECTGAVRFEEATFAERCRGDILPWRHHLAMVTVGLELYFPEPPARKLTAFEALYQVEAISEADYFPQKKGLEELLMILKSFKLQPPPPQLLPKPDD